MYARYSLHTDMLGIILLASKTMYLASPRRAMCNLLMFVNLFNPPT